MNATTGSNAEGTRGIRPEKTTKEPGHIGFIFGACYSTALARFFMRRKAAWSTSTLSSDSLFSREEVRVGQEEVREGLDEGVQDLRQEHPDGEHVRHRSLHVPLLQLGDGLLQKKGGR